MFILSKNLIGCFHTKDKTAGEVFVMGLWKG